MVAGTHEPQTHEPANVTELEELVKCPGKVCVLGGSNHLRFLNSPIPAVRIRLTNLNRVLRVEPADQICVVESGCTLEDLNATLRDFGQVLPWQSPIEADNPSVGGAIALNLPHLGEAVYGTWRNWVLGMTLMRGSGELATCGSSVMKNVAGYDVMKLMVGSRGVLGAITQVTLKTYPLANYHPIEIGQGLVQDANLTISRYKKSDLAAVSGDLVDSATGTAWNVSGATTGVKPIWELANFGETRIRGLTPETISLIHQVQACLDPDRKFYREEFRRD